MQPSWRRSLGIANLRPGQSYDVTGALQRKLTADATASGRLDVDLEDRVEIHIAPRR